MDQTNEEYTGIPPVDPEEMQEDFRKLMVLVNPHKMGLAEYFAVRKKDFSVKSKIFGEIDRIVTKYGITPETLIGDIDKELSLDKKEGKETFTIPLDIANEIYNIALEEIEKQNEVEDDYNE